MFSTIKTAWAAFMAVRNIKWYAVAVVVMLALAGGLYIEFTGLRSTIADMDQVIHTKDSAIGAEREKNNVLQVSLSDAKKQRDDAESRYLQLDAENQKNRVEQDRIQHENAKLAEQLTVLQKNDPGANARIAADVKRLHREAVSAFNAKYGAGGAAQTRSTTGADVSTAN